MISRSCNRIVTVSLFDSGGSTALSQAMLLATKELERGQRIQAESVVVLLSDGKSEDPWEVTKQRAAELHRTGAKVFAVSLSKSVAATDLEAYAGFHGRVFLEHQAFEVVNEVVKLLEVQEESCAPAEPEVLPTTQGLPAVRTNEELKLAPPRR